MVASSFQLIRESAYRHPVRATELSKFKEPNHNRTMNQTDWNFFGFFGFSFQSNKEKLPQTYRNEVAMSE